MTETRPRFRPTPLHFLVGVAALALMGKIGLGWQGDGGPVLAIASPAQAAEKAAPAPAAAPSPAAPRAATAEPAKPAADDGAFDPTRLTAGEVKLLQQLTERRKAIEAREQAVDLREKTTRAAEQRVEERITELKTLKGQVEALLRQHDEQQERQLRALVKIYETMKPKEAARIFEDLEMPVLLNVIERMKEAKTAPVLASMSPEKAKALTVELAERRKLPDAGG